MRRAAEIQLPDADERQTQAVQVREAPAMV
jgi:hypothetical protein